MNDKLLRELFYGNERFLGMLRRGNKEYQRIEKVKDEYEKKICNLLGEEPQKWMDEIWVLEGEMQSEWGYSNFQAGLNFGLWLAVQALFVTDSEEE